jgi:hypothetical protein
MVYLIVFLWFFLGFLSTGFTVSYFQNEYWRINDKAKYGETLLFAFSIGLVGPVALAVSYLMSGFGKYGWSLKYTGEGPLCNKWIYKSPFLINDRDKWNQWLKENQ